MQDADSEGHEGKFFVCKRAGETSVIPLLEGPEALDGKAIA